jgi:branched-chain amino acid transport system permease protein
MTEFIQLMVSSVAQGMIYALVAFGYGITFSTSKTFNFSLGSFLMLGGVVSYIVYMTLKLPIFAAFGAVLLVGGIMGYILQKLAIEPSFKTKSAYGWILATIAVGIVIKNAVEVFWSTDDFRFDSPVGNAPLRFGGVGVLPQEILIIIVSLVIVTVVEVFKRKTLLGKAIVAVSEDKETASLMGINQKFVILFSFILSSIIAMIAGLLVAPITFVSATMGLMLGVKAYAVAIIGGLESGFGVILGGLILGISEGLTARYISTGYKDMTGFFILILVLLYKPTGIFGKVTIKKV